MKHTPQLRLLVAGTLCILGSLLLACGGPPMELGVSRGPRWACPSPVPVPWGEDGPVKERTVVATPNPVTGAPGTVEETYFEQWEQEYGEGGSLLNGSPAFGGPPFPSPTPFALAGNTYTFGQRVEIAPVYALVTARRAEARENGDQLYIIDLTWTNPTTTTIPFSPSAYVWLRTITLSDSTEQSGDGWGVSASELERLGLTMPKSIPPGDTLMRLPIRAPAGEPKVVEVRFPIVSAQPTTSNVTPTPNTDLRVTDTRTLTVQWVKGELYKVCDDPGAMTDWSTDGDSKAIPRDAMTSLQAPAGAPRVVQIALNQVGKRYVWGSTGPNTFDCSGLMYWSYGQIGLRIPRTTGTQWPGLNRVSLGAMQPGDLVYMDTSDPYGGTPRTVTHVGMVADLNGDGTWDLIHAASPKLGVRIDYNVFASRYYGPRLFGEGRTVR